MNQRKPDYLHGIGMHAQAAIDFMVSYGIAMIIIAIALYVIFATNILNQGVLPRACNPVPPFVCNYYALNTSGIFIIKMSQATGSLITINGAACSTAANPANASRPAYGNVNLLSFAAASSFYPTNDLQNGLNIPSGGSATFSVFCYGSSGVARSSIGSTLVGYLWINYTTAGLPGNTILQMAQVSVPYTSGI